MRRPDALPTSCFRAYMQNAYSVFAEWVIRLYASLRVAEAPFVQNRTAHPMLFLAPFYGFSGQPAGTISQRARGIRRRHSCGQGRAAAPYDSYACRKRRAFSAKSLRVIVSPKRCYIWSYRSFCAEQSASHAGIVEPSRSAPRAITSSPPNSSQCSTCATSWSKPYSFPDSCTKPW